MCTQQTKLWPYQLSLSILDNTDNAAVPLFHRPPPVCNRRAVQVPVDPCRTCAVVSNLIDYITPGL